MFIGCFIFSALLSVGCTKRFERNESMQMNGFFFDTVVKIQAWGRYNKQVMIECEELCKHYEHLFDREDEKSDVWKLNHSKGKPVTVSSETTLLIKEAIHYGKMSNGVFDISVAPVSDLWDVKNNPGIIPSQDEIEHVKSHVGYEKIHIQGNTITFEDPEMAIDLGAIAKGYIADQLKKVLEKYEVEYAIIDLGGNVLTLGQKEKGEPFHIGIQKPFAPRGEIITSVSVGEKSVVSSGNYERYFQVDDQIYHHIMNPKTGYPFDNDLCQVTIISDSSLKGDIFSTMCYALGLDEGKKLVEKQTDMQAIFVTNEGKIERVGME